MNRILKNIAKVLIPNFIIRKIKITRKDIRKKRKVKNFIKDIGNDSYLYKSVQVLGWNNVSIGNNTIIAHDSVLNVNIRDGKNIIIGNNCWIGQRTYINAGKEVKINDYALFGEECKLICADHVFNDPMCPYVATGTTNHKSIYLGVNVWLGASVTILGNVNVGYGSIIGANSLVTKSIPPFSISFGNPARIIKRFDFIKKEWVDACDYIEQNIISEDDYLKKLRKKYPNVNLPRVAAGKDHGDLLY